MTVVVLAPHPDDEAIGCGGTLALHAEAGDRVVVLFLTSGERGLPHLPAADASARREAEAAASCAVLGVQAIRFLRLPDWQLWGHLPELSEAIASLLDVEAPGRVYLPHYGEWHPDHQACFFAADQVIVARGADTVPGFAYEIWSPLQAYAHVRDITTVLRQKMRAIRSHQSQTSQFRYDRAARGINAYRGVTTERGHYCEVFADARFGQTTGAPPLPTDTRPASRG